MQALINNAYQFETDILGCETIVHVDLIFDTDYGGNHYTFHISPKNKDTMFMLKLQYKRGNEIYKSLMKCRNEIYELLMNKLKELIKKGEIKEVYYDREKRQFMER